MNRLQDIKALTALMSLEELDLHNTQVTSLEPLTGLKNLRVLNVSFVAVGV
jgi:Leucine-rich repeat (LRR) protein